MKAYKSGGEPMNAKGIAVYFWGASFGGKSFAFLARNRNNICEDRWRYSDEVIHRDEWFEWKVFHGSHEGGNNEEGIEMVDDCVCGIAHGGCVCVNGISKTSLQHGRISSALCVGSQDT